MTPIPARYQRSGSSKLVGFLVYLVVAPFVALFLALFLAVPIMFALEALGVSRDRSGEPFMVLLPLIGVGVAVWARRDFRRRAALEVVIDWDRVTIGIDSRRTVLRFEDVVSIRLVPARAEIACVLVPRSGRSLRLPPEIAPFSLVREALEATLIPEMVLRLDERIAHGDVVALRIPKLRILILTSQAFGALLLSLFLLASLWRFLLGILLLRHATMVLRQSWLGVRGGLIIDREGLRRYSDAIEAATPWTRLEPLRTDPIGLVIRSTNGKIFALSSLTDDYWPVLRWINAKLRKTTKSNECQQIE